MTKINNNKIFILLLTISLYLLNITTAQKPVSINIKVYDQLPIYNDNFGSQARTSIIKNIVSPTLDNTKIPKLGSNGVSTTLQSPNLVQYWFQTNFANASKNSGLNSPLSKTITLNYDSNSGNYVYNNPNFFLIDSDGFDKVQSNRIYKDSTGTYHNYHYCVSFNYVFKPDGQGKEMFTFTGNDDVWVYVNNKLLLDGGGIHAPESISVDFTKASLAKGIDTPLDFFYCERSTNSQPSFKIETNLGGLYCKAYDYCGVCNGDGGTCCNPQNDCLTQLENGTLINDKCSIPVCPPLDTPIDKTLGIGFYCNHIPIADPFAGSLCEKGDCDSLTGIWTRNTSICPTDNDLAPQCRKQAKCDPKLGCQSTYLCNNLCDNGTCNNGTCTQKTSKDCVGELNGGKEDLCFVYKCVPGVGCTKTPKCPIGTDPCKNYTCSAGVCNTTDIPQKECVCNCPGLNKCKSKVCNSDGSCTLFNLTAIDDGNPCTDDYCDPVTGNITHNITQKCSGCNTCDVKTGKCVAQNSHCDDGNPCTDNSCVASANSTSSSQIGVCTQTPTTKCDLGDKCMVYSCTLEGGCNATQRVCPNSGPCKIGYCEPGVGCKLKNRVCSSDWFCIEAQCDETYGCIQFDRRCVPDNSRCEEGICVNNTAIGKDDGKCTSKEYDPKPFVCKTAAVVSTAVVAGVVVAGAVALGAAIFAGKKGYDAWKTSQGNVMAASQANPLYTQANNGGENPLYNSPN
ncbi:hypothetical protein RB653_001007 [Dictyostelium firmibasis]|uniref:PA14 domain-containing protein n=1 Tax=Dictyostelium firmibasis TaxID=79012 RepID=A0AAN7U7N8_9MYCE